LKPGSATARFCQAEPSGDVVQHFVERFGHVGLRRHFVRRFAQGGCPAAAVGGDLECFVIDPLDLEEELIWPLHSDFSSKGQ
jgi:hypothetical protein